ncbi:EAL domain-containing protein [uncultured Oscillibacter sp.]|uniref:EAL domain-containing protein n=1 Tax=uncultured Oscillibacter sp. TaxID=876091 RepID=UPI0025DC0CBC|nr:EAL domain-containing protein [uncultured Oscillibacter sp.]
MTEQKTILVVEDNFINRATLVGILSGSYRVLEAEDGQEALSVLERDRDDISLILLDLVMPKMDGYTFLSIVKADPAYASIPVIVTTQSDSEADEVTALSQGATDFVAKPYKPQVILHRVASIINLRETAAMINQFKYDRLTGLYSKEFFYQRAREVLRRNPERAYDLICSDIENFKLVNDVFGLLAGDRLLVGIAGIYTDLVGSQGICGRLNADQFVCLMERRPAYREEDFTRLEARINKISTSRSIVMKWGVYAIEDRSLPIEQMCDRAFLAANSIKGYFEKHIAFYDDTLRSKLLREQAITNSMEAALEAGQFLVYLQPKYTIRTSKLSGAEALVRWDHPDWGFLAPGAFIPLFEKNGFITKLDQYVWEQSCAVLKRWDEEGRPHLPISVNVSRADIYNADIADVLVGIVEKYGLSPSRLHLEITESAYTENPHQIVETVRRLRELGFVVEMDDFGSGYSSLNMLNSMPVDILKLDMKFIQNETAKPLERGILRFIMDMAMTMGLSVVAEGVETREQLEYLQEVGCNYVQGYYFAKPMPVSQFEELFRVDEVEEDCDSYHMDVRRRKKLLLLADEDADSRAQARAVFQEEYQLVEAETAAAALDCAAEYGHRLSGVLLSLTLPEDGGFPALREFQRERTVWNIPVIATAPYALDLEERALETGADDFIHKPYTAAVLRRRFQRAMGYVDMWERERLLEDAAYQDYLTGLLNRRGMYAAVSMLQEKDAPAAVFMFDMDNMKKINDAMGHTAGDELLRGFGRRLRAHTRETDIVSRFGGDEFVVILKHIGSGENALKKGTEICLAVEQECCGETLAVYCSAGVALWNKDDGMDEILRRADEALYEAKREEKSGCRLWRGEDSPAGDGTSA